MPGTTVITVTHTSDDDNDSVFVDAVNEDGTDLPLTEVLGVLELAKAILLGQQAV